MANFRVEIDRWKRIRSGEYEYRVNRVLNKKKHDKKKGGNNFADEINRKMRGMNK